MPSAADTPTLALVIYPGLWDASCEIHPRTAVDYSWQDHLRCLCRLARALHEEQPIALKVAGAAEKMHVEALATADPEMLILEVLAGAAAHPGSRLWQSDPLWWLDAHDRHLKPESGPEPARTGRPRPYML
jgi:hypothetical protein